MCTYTIGVVEVKLRSGKDVLMVIWRLSSDMLTCFSDLVAIGIKIFYLGCRARGGEGIITAVR